MNKITGEQKLFAIVAHLSYLLAGLGFIIAPLLIVLLKKEDYFVYEHARQALASHVAILAFSLIVSFLTSLIIGILLWPLLWILWVGLVFFSVLASIKALNGKLYCYPLIQKLVNMF